jgi:hypothetical protein
MSRKPKIEAAELSADEQVQAEATQPRRMDENGFELDSWGLPLVGPRRLAVLDGRPDPVVDEDGWNAANAGALGASTGDQSGTQTQEN